MRFVQIAKQHYRDIDGYALVHNMPRIKNLPTDRFCNFIWHWCTRNADEKELEKFEQRLWLPPKGVKGEGVWSAEAEASALSNLKSQLKGVG